MKSALIGVFCREEPLLLAGIQEALRPHLGLRLIAREHIQRIRRGWPLNPQSVLVDM